MSTAVRSRFCAALYRVCCFVLDESSYGRTDEVVWWDGHMATGMVPIVCRQMKGSFVCRATQSINLQTGTNKSDTCACVYITLTHQKYMSLAQRSVSFIFFIAQQDPKAIPSRHTSSKRFLSNLPTTTIPPCHQPTALEIWAAPELFCWGLWPWCSA